VHRIKYAIIGGDMRNVYLAELLKKDYQYVEIYGFEKSGKPWASKDAPLDFILDGARVIIGGIPFVSENGFISTPLSKNKTTISEVIEKIDENSIFIAGKIPGNVKSQLDSKNIKHVDIVEREELMVLNAVPTAEGAIHILIGELPMTLMDSRVLIVGYGRIGKILAKMLQGFGAEVWVAARKYSDIAWIEAQGLKPVPIHQLARYVSDMDAIVNTAPSLVITKEILEKTRSGCLLLDLASNPGGIDFKAAKTLDLKLYGHLDSPEKLRP